MDKVRDLVGRPFVARGRHPVTGMDCWGLVREVYRRYGMEVPDFSIAPNAFHAVDMTMRKEAGRTNWVRVEEPKETDAPLVVLMRLHPGLVTHAGVWIGHGRIIHALEGAGVVVSRVGMLKSRIVGYYRYGANN